MDVLSLLDSVKEDVLIKRHPLADEDLSLRFAYAVGVGVAARADGELNNVEQDALKELVAGLLIPEEQTAKVLLAAANPDKETIKEVLKTLDNRKHQYLFLLDQRDLANRDGNIDEQEWKAIEQFAAMFKMSSTELALWRKLNAAVIAGKFKESEAAFQQIFRGKDAEKTGTEMAEIFRTLVYFWQADAIKDALANMEKEIVVLKNELRMKKKSMDIKNRPIPNRAPAPSYRIKDDFAGEAWDDEREKTKKIITSQLSPRITASEARRDLLIAAIDNMYITS